MGTVSPLELVWTVPLLAALWMLGLSVAQSYMDRRAVRRHPNVEPGLQAKSLRIAGGCIRRHWERIFIAVVLAFIGGVAMTQDEPERDWTAIQVLLTVPFLGVPLVLVGGSLLDLRDRNYVTEG